MQMRDDSPLMNRLSGRTRRSPLARVTVLTSLVVVSAFAFAACSGGDEEATGNGGNGLAGQSGAGSGGASGSGGSAAGSSGTGGFEIEGGASGASGESAGGSAGSAAGGSSTGGSAGESGGDSGAGGTICVPDDPPEPPIHRKCAPPTDNECTAPPMPGAKPEGQFGNGFDDDCDGIVDEGCDCPQVGKVEPCYLVPSTQTTGAPDYNVVGWCDPKAQGTKSCIVTGKGELTRLVWSDQCTGAIAPALNDSCVEGDLNCDGVELNAPNGCKCADEDVEVCGPDLFTRPFPDPNKVGQFTTIKGSQNFDIDGIDGYSWVNKKVLDPEATYDWRWTVTGSFCDDTLPNPTFAVYPTPVAQWTGPNGHLGLKTPNLPKFPKEKQPDPTFNDDNIERNKLGWVLQGEGTPHKIYPAFSLSGSYTVTGKFKSKGANGEVREHQCVKTVKAQAPGLRVELCWPMRDDATALNKNDNDVDLHLARLQGNPGADGKHGWFTTPLGDAPTAPTPPGIDDCYYSPNSACSNRVGNKNAATWTPGWFPPDVEITPEPEGTGVCHGWGSRRFDGKTPNTSPARPCSNPRLDRDNIVCDPKIEDPNSPEADPSQTGDKSNNFCGPENINIDGQALTPGDRYAIGVQCYNCVKGNNSASSPLGAATPRVNVYCDGDFTFGTGYEPSKGTFETQTPALFTEGQNKGGAMWQVGIVTWNGSDASEVCKVLPAQPNGVDSWQQDSWHQQANGSEYRCVNNGPLNADGANFTPALNHNSWKFKPDGSYPATANELCSYLPTLEQHAASFEQR